MNTNEKILKILEQQGKVLETLQAGQTELKQGQARLEKQVSELENRAIKNEQTQERLEKRTTTIEQIQSRLEKHAAENEQTQAKILSILKFVATEGGVEKTVNAAKQELTEKFTKKINNVETELKEAIITLGDKIGKGQREQNIRLNELEEAVGIAPHKN